jgi:hypothetical protein
MEIQSKTNRIHCITFRNKKTEDVVSWVFNSIRKKEDALAELHSIPWIEVISEEPAVIK